MANPNTQMALLIRMSVQFPDMMLRLESVQITIYLIATCARIYWLKGRFHTLKWLIFKMQADF